MKVIFITVLCIITMFRMFSVTSTKQGLEQGLAFKDLKDGNGNGNGNDNISNAPPTVDRRRIT